MIAESQETVLGEIQNHQAITSSSSEPSGSACNSDIRCHDDDDDNDGKGQPLDNHSSDCHHSDEGQIIVTEKHASISISRGSSSISLPKETLSKVKPSSSNSSSNEMDLHRKVHNLETQLAAMNEHLNQLLIISNNNNTSKNNNNNVSPLALIGAPLHTTTTAYHTSDEITNTPAKNLPLQALEYRSYTPYHNAYEEEEWNVPKYSGIVTTGSTTIADDSSTNGGGGEYACGATTVRSSGCDGSSLDENIPLHPLDSSLGGNDDLGKDDNVVTQLDTNIIRTKHNPHETVADSNPNRVPREESSTIEKRTIKVYGPNQVIVSEISCRPTIPTKDRSNSIRSEEKNKQGITIRTTPSRLQGTKQDDELAVVSKSKSNATECNTVESLFQILNLDSLRQDGSATSEVDANMDEFLCVPYKLEGLLLFGLAICVDSFLHVLTVVPLKFAWSCLCFICTVCRPMTGGIGRCRFHRRHLYQLARGLIIYATYHYCLCPISIGKLYHWIRGQEMLKLYVLMAMVEIFDRLMCSLGQDALDSLYWNITRRPCHPRTIISVVVVLIYAMIHSMILLAHVATLNVAMNSADQALLSLLIGGNFAEIKSTVFKKYNKAVLFKITSSDICERFKLVLFLGLVLLLNCTQGGDKNMVNDYLNMSCIIMSAEMVCDWIKHSFITKFNFIKSSAYRDYALILAGDVTGVGHEGVNIDHTHAVVKRLGFAQIPLFCVMARYIREAARYADILGDAGDSNHVIYSFAVVYAHGSWSLVTGILLAVFAFFLVLKMLLGHVIKSVAHSIIVLASSDEKKKIGASNKMQKASKITNCAQGNGPAQRRQAA